jgi:aminoglycoside phosphotransferase (APT) family kinase protein
VLSSPDYFWGLLNGDAHPGQFLFKIDGSGDTALIDWGFAAIYGNPAVDIVTFSWASFPPSEIEPIEIDMLETYWLALIDGGVNPSEYTFEKL